MSRRTSSWTLRRSPRSSAEAGPATDGLGHADAPWFTEASTGLAETPPPSPPTVDWDASEADPTVRLDPAGDPSVPSQVDRVIAGRYCLERELGRGGFGVVCLAYDRDLHRQVAVKIARCSGNRGLDQLMEEGRKVAQLDHANVVPVYDCGRIDEATIFIVSKFIDGGSLARQVALRRLPIAEVVRIAGQVAEGLAHAHERGLIHRDLKPANVLVDSRGVAYVADFGLALRSSDRSDHDCVEGSPLYMSPEQANGKSRLVDRRTDVFSFGVILYELLTGRRPFPGRSAAEYRDQVIHEEPIPPRLLDPAIPEALERLCLKALEKDPSRRHSSAWELARDLRAWDEPPAPPPPPRRRPDATAIAVVAAAAVAVVLLAVALAWVLRRAGAPGVPPAVAAAPAPRPDLDVARWALGRGGLVDFETDPPRISSIEHLPERPGTLRSVSLYKAAPFSRDDAATLATLDGLRYLNLSDTTLGDDALAEVAGLTGLRKLWLGYNPIGDAGVVRLAALTGLDQLGLAETDAGDLGVEAVCAARGLTVLELSGTRVTDRCLVAVSGLPRLRRLFLNETAITDAAVDHLLRLGNLEVLEVQGTDLSDAALARLRAGLPRCEIVR